jgi:hypothetical protein
VGKPLRFRPYPVAPMITSGLMDKTPDVLVASVARKTQPKTFSRTASILSLESPGTLYQ